MLRQIELVVQNGPITKNGVLPVTTLFFENFVPVYKAFVWSSNYSNVHIYTFRKR